MDKDEEIKKRIKERLDKLRTRRGFIYSKLNPDYPLYMKRFEEATITTQVEKICKNIASIKGLIKSVRKLIPNIWDQTGIAAVYILLGKSFSSLETVIELAPKGHSYEIVEISRSGVESLDLVFFFLEEGHEDQLKKWFEGKIIGNDAPRKAFHRAINKFVKETTNPTADDLPIEDLKKDVYHIYSGYTHSSYPALLDMIDVFKEDFDFDRYSGFHYTLQYLHLVKNIEFNILLGLKNLFSKYDDEDNLIKVEKLLKEIGYDQSSQEEVDEVIKKYSKHK